MSAVGWRLTVEPCADLVAWSLLRRDAGTGGRVDTWSGLIEDASSARRLTGRLTSGVAPGLTDQAEEALGARELGTRLLPGVLRRELADAAELSTLTVCARGWLARVPWDALAVNQDGRRVIEAAVVLGGVAPGLLTGRDGPPARPSGSGGTARGLWVVDPGPPDGPWPPVFPSGYPEAVTRLVAADDRLVPDGLRFGADELSAELSAQAWGRLIYLGHIGAESDSPAAAGLVLAGPTGTELFTAHRWLREPDRWPAPERVALIGCGSDDARESEQTGLVTAAVNAGADVVVGTRWPLANDDGTLRLVTGLAEAFAGDAVLRSLRRWQLDELGRWRRAPERSVSPASWAALVCYDRRLLVGGGVA